MRFVRLTACLTIVVALMLLRYTNRATATFRRVVHTPSVVPATVFDAIDPNISDIAKLPISSSAKAVMYLVEHTAKDCRSCNKVQQKLVERSITANVLDNYKAGANFLVFGLGFDSIMWCALNTGRTVFLEDNREWFDTITRRAPFLEAYLVDYAVRSYDYPQSMSRQRSDPKCNNLHDVGEDCFLRMALPEPLRDVEWDVIMIDAPSGSVPASGDTQNLPTRQMPIFTAAAHARSKASGRPTHVMVHDVHRPIERVFSNTYLCEHNLVQRLERSGKLFPGSRLALRHYLLDPLDNGCIGGEWS